MPRRISPSRRFTLAAFVLFAAGWFASVAGAASLPAAVDEASGLAASGLMAGRYWTHNDNINLPASSRKNPPLLFAIDPSGVLLGSVTLTGVRQRDWEGISQMRLAGQPTLIVGDIGDNRDTWSDYTLWFVPEPATLAPNQPTPIAPTAVLRFRYPDQIPAPKRQGGYSGGHDAESLAVDAASGQILILTKREKPARLFALPLSARTALTVAANGQLNPTLARCPVITATELAHLPPLPAPTLWQQLIAPLIGPYADQPTDLAISPKGHLIAVLSYAAIYYFAHPAGQSWADSLRQPVAIDPLPQIDQWEGLSFSPDGHSVQVVREGQGDDTLLERPLPPAVRALH